jgi:UDP-N-acetylmuramoylalanine--D-glutamate ligase
MLSPRGRRALVLGLGDTGYSMARWLHGQGAQVQVADTRAEPPHALKLRRDLPQAALHTGAFRDSLLREADFIAVSPGVALADPLLQQARAAGVEIVGDVELFARSLNASAEMTSNSARVKVIGITGSNGKSSVTTMIGEMCQAAGLDTVVAGNIGLPVLDTLPREAAGAAPQVYVLELSSFQLETTASLRLDAATVLNVTEDHMDRYRDIADYAAAKQRIFLNCKVQVLNRDDPFSLGMATSRDAFDFGLDPPAGPGHWGLVRQQGADWLAEGSQCVMPLSELAVAGLHNAANALAALALTRAIGLPYPKLVNGLRRFRGLPHRVEKVMEIEGVAFYDDSKGTNVGATVAALNGMMQTVVLIAGGEGKGQDFTPLREAVQAKARAVILIGRDAERIATAIAASGVRQIRAKDMQDAVDLSFRAARPQDAVLLSPACASFDMFNNYAHRAQVFVEAVRALAARQRAARRAV